MRKICSIILILVAISSPLSTFSQDLFDSFDNCSPWSAKVVASNGYLWTPPTFCEAANSRGVLQTFGVVFDVSKRMYIYRSYNFKPGHTYVIKVKATIVRSASNETDPARMLNFKISTGLSGSGTPYTDLLNFNTQYSTPERTFSALYSPGSSANNAIFLEASAPISTDYYNDLIYIHEISIDEDPCTGSNASISGNPNVCVYNTTLNAVGSGVAYYWFVNGQQTENRNTMIYASGNGTYVLKIVDVNGCVQSSAPVSVITWGEPPIPTISGDIAGCGSATITSSPGTSYKWSTGETTQSITVTQSGSYTVKVTNQGGCESMPSNPRYVTIYDPGLATIDGEEVICTNNSPTTVLTAPDGYQYQWSNGETTQSINAAPGTYSVSTYMLINAHPAPLVYCWVNSYPRTVRYSDGGYINSYGDLCRYGYVDLVAGSGYTHSWSTGVMSESITVFNEGLYSVSYKNYDGCTTYAEVYVVRDNSNGDCRIMDQGRRRTGIPEGIGEITQESGSTVFPNPANDHFKITLSHPAQFRYPVNLMDATGRILSTDSFEVGDLEKVLYTSSLPAGIYYVKMTEQKRSYHVKVIINH